MLRNVYLPLVKDGDTRTSNWDVGKQKVSDLDNVLDANRTQLASAPPLE